MHWPGRQPADEPERTPVAEKEPAGPCPRVIRGTCKGWRDHLALPPVPCPAARRPNTDLPSGVRPQPGRDSLAPTRGDRRLRRRTRLAGTLLAAAVVAGVTTGPLAGADTQTDQIRAAQLQLEISGASQQILSLQAHYNAERWAAAVLEHKIGQDKAALAGTQKRIALDERSLGRGSRSRAGRKAGHGGSRASWSARLRTDRTTAKRQLATVENEDRQVRADLAGAQKETKAAVTVELQEDRELAAVNTQIAADEAAAGSSTAAPGNGSPTAGPTAGGATAQFQQAVQQATVSQAPASQWLASAGGIPPEDVPIFQSAGAATGIPWLILAAVAYHESRFEPQAVGVPVPQWCGGRAVGMMQFASSGFSGGCAPGSFETYESPVPPGGADPPSPFDPTDAVWAAARLLAADGGAANIAGALTQYSGGDASYPAAIEAIARSFSTQSAP